MEYNTPIFATGRTWLEQNALDQFAFVRAMPNVHHAVAFPDLHAGKGSPVGMAAATTHTIYPHLVGNDIGCGMALFCTQISAGAFKVERAIKRLGDYASFADLPLELADASEPSLGTIGGGNHFAELVVPEAENLVSPQSCTIDPAKLCLIVHSGSRGLGEVILRRAIQDWRAQDGLAITGPGAAWYLEEHRIALSWAKNNRRLIGARLLEGLGFKDSCGLVSDTVDNGIEEYQQSASSLWVHRKGAAKADSGPVLIAGSRGSHSYLVEACKPATENLWSLAHGAGRKWQRSAVKGKLGKLYTLDSIKRTRLGSQVFCRERDLLFEEAPEAYKNIEQVIADLVHFGLIKVLVRFRPVLTVKF